MQRILMAIAVVTLFVGVSGCKEETQTAPAQTRPSAPPAPPYVRGSGTIMDELKADGHFEILIAEIEKAGLSDRLSGDGPFTLFAPADHAYQVAQEGYHLAVLGIRRVEPLPKEPDELSKVLLRHVLPGKIMAAQLKEQQEEKSLAGVPVSFDIEGDIATLASRASSAVRRWDDMFMVNFGPHHTPEGEKVFSPAEYTSNLISTDMEASNGVIHVIDAVLLSDLPQTESSKEQE